MDKKSMVFIVAALAAAFLIGANTNSVSDEIKTRKLILVDATGQTLAILSSDADGGVMEFFNKSGKKTVVLGSDEDGGKMAVNDKKGEEALALECIKDGGVMIVRAKTGEEVIQIKPDENGKGTVGAYDLSGNGREFKPGP